MKKNIRKLSQTLTTVEKGGPESLRILKGLYSKRKQRPVLGITGLPGSGKSTLIDQLILCWRKEKKTVGVIAVDPSSPFSGGAILGDRIRMQRHAADEGVFIRSLGSRGAHGGLSRATQNCTLVLDAYSFDQIIVETVGVGQTELDIMNMATTTVVILTPESGDAVQTLKAGLNEIADIFVVNKADRPGADELAMQLQAMSRPVLLTEAEKGVGIEELKEVITERQANLKKDPSHRQHQETLRRQYFLNLVLETYQTKLLEQFASNKQWQKFLEQVAHDQANPFEILEKIVAGDRIESFPR